MLRPLPLLDDDERGPKRRRLRSCDGSDSQNESAGMEADKKHGTPVQQPEDDLELRQTGNSLTPFDDLPTEIMLEVRSPLLEYPVASH